jgi:hypothetical protein
MNVKEASYSLFCCSLVSGPRIDISPSAIISSVEVSVTVSDGMVVADGSRVGVGVNVLEGTGESVGERVTVGEGEIVLVSVGGIGVEVLVRVNMTLARGRK